MIRAPMITAITALTLSVPPYTIIRVTAAMIAAPTGTRTTRMPVPGMPASAPAARSARRANRAVTTRLRAYPPPSTATAAPPPDQRRLDDQRPGDVQCARRDQGAVEGLARHGTRLAGHAGQPEEPGQQQDPAHGLTGGERREPDRPAGTELQHGRAGEADRARHQAGSDQAVGRARLGLDRPPRAVQDPRADGGEDEAAQCGKREPHGDGHGIYSARSAPTAWDAGSVLPPAGWNRRSVSCRRVRGARL